MAPPPGTLRVSRYFLALVVILGVLYTLVYFPGNRHKPKLGIDLVGGIRVIFTARPPANGQITSNAMDQARQIISDRVNSTGVTGSTVQVQGTDQLVVSIPGGTGTDVRKLGQAAQLNFRPLIAPAQPVTCNPKLKPTSGTSTSTAPSGSTPSGSTSATPTVPSGSSSASRKPSSPAVSRPSGASSSTAGTNGYRERPIAAPASPVVTPSKAVTPAPSKAVPTGTKTTPPSTSAPSTSASASTPAVAPACVTDPFAVIVKSDKTLKIPTTEAAYSKLTSTQQQTLAAALQNYDCNHTQDEVDNPKSWYVACDSSGYAYLLGTVIVKGTQIDQATAIAPSTSGGQGLAVWSVQLRLKGSGDDAWGKWTTAHNTAGSSNAQPTQCSLTALPCNDFVAFTLNGAVLSAPSTQSAIVGTPTQITGNFTQKSANDLTDQLNFGALPLTFRADSTESVSASLGTTQLKAALLAGGIGLFLVIIYSLLYYRALGLITIASLLVSAGLTYAMLVILGTQIGFTLDLSGIAGFIVALGITADSFVVFFERIKDEVHEGRSIRVAIPRAWVRARRTILSADTVSFLAAAILYYFASADVKGFAFTLGMSTILDLVVVFLFTHPIVSVLSRSRAFGSARFTGLNSVRVGGITQDAEAPRGKRAAARPTGSRGATSTVVLDKTAPATTDVTTADDEPVDAAEGDEMVDGADGPRRRTTPAATSAAERAAARRARQRGTTDEGNAS